MPRGAKVDWASVRECPLSEAIRFSGMDRREAQAIIAVELTDLRKATYPALVERLLGKQETFERVGTSGARYQVEIQAVWDDRPDGNLRVLAAIDDGGWRAFAPLSDSFICAPDGGFIGE